MDAIEMIKQDHRRIEELFDKFFETESETTQENLFQQIESGLTAHSDMEEQVLYERVKTFAKDEVEKALKEHMQVKELLGDLLDMDINEEGFESRFNLLQEDVLNHVQEEEGSGGLLEIVRQHFDENELNEMAAQMREIQKSTEEDLAA